MGRRPLLLMVLGWLAVVVAVGAITFLVVDRAGRGVGQASAAARVAVPPNFTSSGTPGPTSGAPSRTTPDPTTTTRTTPTASRSPEPTPVRTSPDDPRDTESFTSEAGTVVATCTGAQITLDSIRPRDGWRFETESEHGGLKVDFRNDDGKVEMLLISVRGVPTRSTDDD